jgi:hypothetical protein
MGTRANHMQILIKYKMITSTESRFRERRIDAKHRQLRANYRHSEDQCRNVTHWPDSLTPNITYCTAVHVITSLEHDMSSVWSRETMVRKGCAGFKSRQDTD